MRAGSDEAATFRGPQLPRVPSEAAAHALIGAHRALLDHVRSRVQGGDNLAGLAAEVGKLADGAFELLELGLRAYAAAPPAAADEAG